MATYIEERSLAMEGMVFRLATHIMNSLPHSVHAISDDLRQWYKIIDDINRDYGVHEQ